MDEIKKTNTSFCAVEVELGHNASVWIDGNSKITARNGTYSEPTPNAFSLPHVATCPGSTPFCRKSCYVHNLEKHAPDVFAMYKHNERVVHLILECDDLYVKSTLVLGEWIENNCKDFRWHVSGDVFGKDYAGWIVNVCKDSPGVRHWIYTRSHWLVKDLLNAPNLTVNLSADKDNLTIMENIHVRFPSTRLCYMTSDVDPKHLPVLPDDSVIFPDYALRGRELDEPTTAPWWLGLSHREKTQVCPADFFGQSQHHRCGPCDKCLNRA